MTPSHLPGAADQVGAETRVVAVAVVAAVAVVVVVVVVAVAIVAAAVVVVVAAVVLEVTVGIGTPPTHQEDAPTCCRSEVSSITKPKDTVRYVSEADPLRCSFLGL